MEDLEIVLKQDYIEKTSHNWENQLSLLLK